MLNENEKIENGNGLNWDDIKNTENAYLRDHYKSQIRKNFEKGGFDEFFNRKIKEEGSTEDDSPALSQKIPKHFFWKDLNREIFPEESWRIKNLIPKQGFVILASISGNRKTWCALEMGKSLTEDKNFLDDENFKTEGCNVLYIDNESSKSEIQRRGRQLGFKEETPFKFYIIKEDNLNLNQEEADIWLKSFIEFYQIGVVFIDTFISVSEGVREDKAEEVRKFFNKFNSLKNSGVSVVWLMHLRKPNFMEGKVPKKEQVLGSQDKIASVEVLLMVHSEPGSEEINLYQRKNRLGIEIEPFKIIMKDSIDEEGKTNTYLSYGGVIEESENKKDQAKELILEILETGGKTTKEILELTKKQVGSKNTRNALTELSREKLIDISKQGKSNYHILNKENEVNQDIDGF